MKRTIILLLALTAALTSGFAVFHQLTNQMEKAPTMDGAQTSEEAIADMLDSSLDSSDGTAPVEEKTMIESEGEDRTVPTTLNDDGMIAVASPSSSSTPTSAEKSTAVYAAFTKEVIGNGQPAMLFFYAPWCPECRAADTILKVLYKSGSPTMSTYRVDYDTEKDVKKTYGIVRQTTFVLIDGTGKAQKTLLSPSSTELANAVQ